MRYAVMAALLLAATTSSPAQAASSGDGERLLGPTGVPLFITGMNYEGPADRAWQMWDPGKFDGTLIDADLQRASDTAGVNVVRIFVQAGLVTDIASSKWDKLDTVVDLAEKHKIQLVISLARLRRARPRKSEGDRRPDGAALPQSFGHPRVRPEKRAALRRPGVDEIRKSCPTSAKRPVDTFGEQLPRDQLADYRASDDGVKTVPNYLSDDEAYTYVNNLRLYRAMLADVAAWVKAHGGTTLDYLDDAAGQKWQAFQKSVLQGRPEEKSFAFLNTFDVMHDRGLDNWLALYRQTPPALDTAADNGLPFSGVMARHLSLLDGVPPPLKAAFVADPDWLDHYGLPLATQDTPNSVVVRAQRAALQYWKEAVPRAAKGTVSVANGGDLAKESGVFPWQAVTPENAPR